MISAWSTLQVPLTIVRGTDRVAALRTLGVLSDTETRHMNSYLKYSFSCQWQYPTKKFVGNTFRLLVRRSTRISFVLMNTSYQRLSEVSCLPSAEILALAARLQRLEINPDDIRSQLIDREATRMHQRAGWDVIRGLVLVVASIALVTLAPALTKAGQAVAVVCALGSAIFIGTGLGVRKTLNQRLQLARKHRSELEGGRGFLWHFQELLEHLDSDGPVEVHKSLIRCCKASRRREEVRDRGDLTQYWYWISLIEMHLVMAEKGIHDELLKPHEVAPHE